MVIDPMVNRAHHGGACSSSSLVEINDFKSWIVFYYAIVRAF